MTSGDQGNSGGFMITSNSTRKRGPELAVELRHCCRMAFRCGWDIAAVCSLSTLQNRVEERKTYQV
jgi:hypothetical protein